MPGLHHASRLTYDPKLSPSATRAATSAMATSHRVGTASGPDNAAVTGPVKRQRSNREFGLYAETGRGSGGQLQQPDAQARMKHEAASAPGEMQQDEMEFFDDDDDDFSPDPSRSQLSIVNSTTYQDFSRKHPPPTPSPRWDSLAHNPSAVLYDPAKVTRQTNQLGTPTVSPPGSACSMGHAPPAFSGLSAHPYRADPPARAFPLSNRSRDNGELRSPLLNTTHGVHDVRPSTAGEINMVENFSRPRKTSIKYKPQDALVFSAPHGKQFPGLEQDQSVPSHPPVSVAQLSLRSRTRGLSGSSAQSSSTSYSSILHQPSNDQLSSAYRNPPARNANASLPVTSAPSTRPPPVSNHSHPHMREVTRIGPGEETRASFRSQLTTSSVQGTLLTHSGTERSSVLTKASSMTEGSIINSYNRVSTYAHSAGEGGLSVEDVMGMYENGFESDMEDSRYPVVRLADGDTDTLEFNRRSGLYDLEASRPPSSHSTASRMGARLLEAMSDPLPMPGALPIPGADARGPRDSPNTFRRSLLPSSLPKDLEFGTIKQRPTSQYTPSQEDKVKRDSAKLVDGDASLVEHDKSESFGKPAAVTMQQPAAVEPTPAAPTSGMVNFPQEPPEDPGSRDRYGFRKANTYISREQYDNWESGYSEYLARRRKKWVVFLKDNSLMTENPNRFPARNAKTKRFIRKGIPPDWRGAAWFYYARGPAILAKHPGTYDDLVRRAGLEAEGSGQLPGRKTEVKPLIVEDIEKDLNRTFPDNVHFKPPGSPRSEALRASQNTSHDESMPEPKLISSLRRVLHAFALYNPRIGYCQSLNFLAGMLLLFVETEEQAFWLLNVITRVYLPGTHEMSLEGSKVDLGVLMTALKDSMPGVWKHISGDELEPTATTTKKGKKRSKDDKNSSASNDPNRLPAITLCMTAWFMSCFIGTLPVETVLRVWDIFFYEGSRTLFRVALAVFKVGEAEIKAVRDPMEMFGVVQTIPRRLLDPNALLETCYKRRNGISHLSQDVVEEKRKERRDDIRKWKDEQDANQGLTTVSKAAAAGLDLAAPHAIDLDGEVRRKGTLFGRKKDREQARAAEVM